MENLFINRSITIYGVIEKYQRKYMDVNRPITCAYEDQEVDQYYCEYLWLISYYFQNI